MALRSIPSSALQAQPQRNGLLRQLPPMLCVSPAAALSTPTLRAGRDVGRSLALSLQRRSPRLGPAARKLLCTSESSHNQQEAPEEAPAGTVTRVNQETFWKLVHGAGDKLVVLELYTNMCPPCERISPQIEELSRQYTDVMFLKVDCSRTLNTELATELRLQVVPTFKLFKRGEAIRRYIDGAKYEELVALIDVHRVK